MLLLFRRIKDDSKVKRKRTRDPTNETLHDSDEDYDLENHLDISGILIFS